MKKTIFKAFAVSCALALVSSVSFAQIEFVPDNGAYILKGTNEIHEANLLSVEISNEGEVYHASYIVPDKDGNFTYTFSLSENAPAAEYSIKVASTSGVLSVSPNKFSHATPNKKNDIITLLENASDRSSAKSALFEAVKYAMISYPENNMTAFPSSWTEKMQNSVHDQIKDFSGFTLDNYSTVVNEMYAVAALSNATASNVNDIIAQYEEILDFSGMTDYYNIYITSNQSRINAMFLKNEFANISEAREVFKQIVVLDKINNEDAPAKIVSLIESFSSVLPSEVTLLGNEEKLTLAGKVIDDREKGTSLGTVSDLESYIPSAGSTERPGGATTSTSGGGSSSGGGSKISFVPSPADTNAQGVSTLDTAKISFADVNDANWARDAIESLVRKGIITGYADGDFRPNNYVTREEFVKIIVLAFDIALSDNDAGFSDVSKDFWAYEYINAAKKNSVVNGISNSEFGVGQNITRQDMAVIIANALSLKGKEVIASDAMFGDDADISSYAKDAVYKLKGSGIIAGYEDNTFKPYSNATRAEATQMIYNVIEMLG